MQLFFPEKGLRSQALHSLCNFDMCSPYCTFPPPPGWWGCCCFFFLVADSQWTSIYIPLDRFLFLYRKEMAGVSSQRKKKRKKKTWEDIPISEILGNISEKKKKKVFYYFILSIFFSTIHPQPSPSSARGGREGTHPKGKGDASCSGGFFILFWFINLPFHVF